MGVELAPIDRDFASLNLQNAARHAEGLIQEMGVTRLPVDPFAIAERHGIEVVGSATTGISGCLIRAGNRFGILYTTHIENKGFQRFTVAHELGHYFLPGHIDALVDEERCEHPSRCFEGAPSLPEQEADAFAAELLMPAHLFVNVLREAGEGLRAVECLARACQTSITATALRYATCAENPVAVIVSRELKVDRCFVSEVLREIPGIGFLGKGDLLPPDTLTFQFSLNPVNIASGAEAYGRTTLSQWFTGAPEVEMKEDVVGLGSYGKTLTVLYTQET